MPHTACVNLRRLAVVSHVVHYRHAGKLHATGGYAREIDIWADLFPEVVICAPWRDDPPPVDAVPFSRANIVARPLPDLGCASGLVRAGAVLLLPWWMLRLAFAVRGVDTVHIRCPGNWGLVGALLGPLLGPRRIAKYAGQWPGYAAEAFSYRVQKALLRSGWWNAPVTVYGRWPGQPPHVRPFFTSVMNGKQMAKAEESAAVKHFGPPWRLLYVGRLSREKNVGAAIEALADLNGRGAEASLEVAGDGPWRGELEALVRAHGLATRVTFLGAAPFEQVQQAYARAHFLVLVSQSEGWPKAISEGMAFGLVCVGSRTGLIPQMLEEGRGVCVAPGDAAALAAALWELTRNPDRCAETSRRAAAWSTQYSLESLRDALRGLMEECWGVRLIQSRGAAALCLPDARTR